MIAAMKRKVARHRWKRAISAVRLSYKLAGKPPKFENPVVAPGCENQNRFVDMNEMMSEAMRSQPKYFREGSVMHNLIESGIELVWFSDVSQNDVVYGICVQREEKKVTVVFRGTVRLSVLCYHNATIHSLVSFSPHIFVTPRTYSTGQCTQLEDESKVRHQ